MEMTDRNAGAGKTALVVGSTGISGRNLAAFLSARGWTVYGLARNPGDGPRRAAAGSGSAESRLGARGAGRAGRDARIYLHMAAAGDGS